MTYLEQLAASNTDPQALAELAKGRLRNKLPQLRQALAGRLVRLILKVAGC